MQPDSAMPNHSGDPFSWLVTELKLAEDQRSSFKSIMQVQHEKRMALHQQYRNDREAGKEAIVDEM